MLPYTIQLIVFWLWSNFILEAYIAGFDKDSNYNDLAALVLIIVSSIKMLTELIQYIGSVLLQDQPWKFWKNSYLLELKNWLEIIGTDLIFINCVRSIINDAESLKEDEWFWYCQVGAALCIWARFIFYLRSIEAMSYITRMIVEVIKDMLAFGVVLTIVVIAMADSFLSIKEISKLESQENITDIDQDLTSITDESGKGSYRAAFDSLTGNYLNQLQDSYLLTLGEFGPFDDQGFFTKE